MSDQPFRHKPHGHYTTPAYYYGKRAIDLIIASSALLTLLPLFITIGALIKLTSAGPIFECQPRMGVKRHVVNGPSGTSIVWKSTIFLIYQFRVPSPPVSFHSENDKRPHPSRDETNDKSRSLIQSSQSELDTVPPNTPIGKFLRWTHIDELPLLINILRGEMSIVGPTPMPLDQAEQCQERHPERLTVQPGITGLSQLEGCELQDFDTMMEIDRQYVNSRSIWLDLKIMCHTILAVMFR